MLLLVLHSVDLTRLILPVTADGWVVALMLRSDSQCYPL